MSLFTKHARHTDERRLDYKRGLEDARRFKLLGISEDIIAEGTGLSKDEIEALLGIRDSARTGRATKVLGCSSRSSIKAQFPQRPTRPAFP
ncbi:MAG: hypothetical protein WCL50_10085 [Spirochaetota bacterium]